MGIIFSMRVESADGVSMRSGAFSEIVDQGTREASPTKVMLEELQSAEWASHLCVETVCEQQGRSVAVELVSWLVRACESCVEDVSNSISPEVKEAAELFLSALVPALAELRSGESPE
jgi:hypothetical protein